MPWCPKCKEEYREEFKRCSTCGSTLVAELPQEPEEQEMDAGAPVLLTWSNNNLTLQMMDGALRDAGIPFTYKELGLVRGSNPHMRGGYDGVEIYVPEKLLGRARQVISIFSDEAKEDPAKLLHQSLNSTDDEAARRKRRRNVITACIFMFVVVPGAIVLYLWLSGIM